VVDLNKIENSTFWGSGWAFPIVFEVGNYQLETSSREENINQSIDVILKTRKGERSVDANFGSGLHQFLFQTMDETLKGEIVDTVKIALLEFEPRITVLNVSVDFVDRNEGFVNIHITYEVNTTNTRHNYVFPFYIKEGTNL